MERFITVKGTGHVEVAPDQIELSFSLSALDEDYGKSIQHAAWSYQTLVDAIVQCGFKEEDIKTSDYSVSAEYRTEKHYHDIFVGWKCDHDVNIKFPLDMDLLGRVIDSVTQPGVKAETDLRFFKSGSEAVQQALLESAARNARKKAEILCVASGVKLGELCRIDYSWGEIRLYSESRVRPDQGEDCICSLMPDVHPENIEVDDSATFVWSIEK